MKDICLITGAAGFIGFHLSTKLLNEGYEVIGFDNVNDYYERSLKLNRLKELNNLSLKNNLSWTFIKGNLEDKNLLDNIFKKRSPSIVINLAAQAGVRYSLKNPDAYIKSNIVGFNNLIECASKYKVNSFIYASSSSVYGNNKKIPFSENDNVDQPVSLYAATKRSNELIAYSYSYIHGLNCTGIRFFTIYGPWGRPDMAPMIFAKSMLNYEPIKIFNNGQMERDFTYIDDAIHILFKLVEKTKRNSVLLENNSNKNELITIPHQIFNIGNNNPVPLMQFIKILEKELNIVATKDFREMQLGDVKRTFADISKIESYLGIKPKTSVEIGVKKFVSWFKKYYQYQ